jgi:hypothetical protein
MTLGRVRALSVAGAAALVLNGCGVVGGSGGDAGGCKDAVAEAAEAASMPERKRRLRPAFEACESLAGFAAAVARHPEALEGVDVERYVRGQCREVPALKDSPLCEAFG